MDKTAWKELKEIEIVYEAHTWHDCEVDGKIYPKAYIVESGNKKQLQSAISWAGGDKNIVRTENKDFTFRIINAAGNSYQGGKLSFWMCLMEKPGVPPFLVGINADLLSYLIVQSSFKNGILQDKTVFFARCSGQLGVLHEGMKEYSDFIATQQLKAKVEQSKTTKWQPGYIYETQRTRDVCLGYVKMPLQRDDKSTWREEKLELNFDAEKVALYTYEYSDANAGKKDLEEWLETALTSSDRFSTKYPARMEGKQIYKPSDDYDKEVATAILNASQRRFKKDDLYYWSVGTLSLIMTLYVNHPDKAIKMLDDLLAFHKKQKSEAGSTHYILKYNGDTFTYDKYITLVDKLRDIAIEHNRKEII